MSDVEDEPEEDRDSSDDSGPFCPHWRSPPSDCRMDCDRCGHPCVEHDGECDEDGCECPGVVENS